MRVAIKRVFAGIAVLMAVWVGFASPAMAQPVQQQAVAQDVVQAGCNGTYLPGNMIRVKDGQYWFKPTRTACQQCDDASYTWRHYGYRTWCWQTSASSAELWLFVSKAANAEAANAKAAVATADDVRADSWWYRFGVYPDQGACEAQRAHGVHERWWTWDTSVCATNGTEWALLIKYD